MPLQILSRLSPQGDTTPGHRHTHLQHTCNPGAPHSRFKLRLGNFLRSVSKQKIKGCWDCNSEGHWFQLQESQERASVMPACSRLGSCAPAATSPRSPSWPHPQLSPVHCSAVVFQESTPSCAPCCHHPTTGHRVSLAHTAAQQHSCLPASPGHPLDSCEGLSIPLCPRPSPCLLRKRCAACCPRPLPLPVKPFPSL